MHHAKHEMLCCAQSQLESSVTEDILYDKKCDSLAHMLRGSWLSWCFFATLLPFLTTAMRCP